LGSAAMDEQCPICLGDLQGTIAETLSCSHRVCVDCLKRYLSLQIKEAQVPIGCPGSNCVMKVQSYEINRNVSSEEFTRYRRFLFMKTEVNARECPRCHVIQTPELGSEPQMVCGRGKLFHADENVRTSGCGYQFCLVHSDAHSGRTCSDYQKQVPNDQETQTLLNELGKPCPYCGQYIERHADTCDHVRCIQCKNDFCFKCGRAGTLTGKYSRQCSGCGQDFIDHQYAICWIILMIFLCPFWTVLSILSFPCCVCMFKCTRVLLVYLCMPLTMILGLCGCLTQRFFESIMIQQQQHT